MLLIVASLVCGQNNNCSGSIALQVGTSFASGAITSTNIVATTDGPLPSCNSNVVDNVWFTLVIPQSGNIIIETRGITGSSFNDSTLSIYTGTCSSLTEVGCNDDSGIGDFSLIVLSGQTPGATLYVSVWKYDVNQTGGEFQISAYEPNNSNNNCSGSIPLAVAGNFVSGSVIANNKFATTDGPIPTCNIDAVDNMWFTVTVPQSGNITVETRGVAGSGSSSFFDDSTLSIYSGVCGSFTQIGCDDDNGQGNFSMISLSSQIPGSVLYVSISKYDSGTSSGEFQISAYDNSLLSTQDVSTIKKITVSPNPFTDNITISDISEVKSISVIDISGRIVKDIKKLSSSIYLGDLSVGVYMINLYMNDGSIRIFRVVKNK